MQLVVITLTCAYCQNTNRLVLSDQSKERLTCKACGAFLLNYLVVNGFLYVLANPAMPGLVKIGFTSRSVEERVQELNAATGVPENFKIVAYFGCADPAADEKTVHQALASSRTVGKEFFRISITEAITKIESILQRKPLFIYAPEDHITKYELEYHKESEKNWAREMPELEKQKSDLKTLIKLKYLNNQELQIASNLLENAKDSRAFLQDCGSFIDSVKDRRKRMALEWKLD